ncbi:MAG TPA: NAD(P)-dependent oxidoreductase, partial [Ramlibacter sp.]|nr:NAD(P)-dependent oxidoreductase [Ramlibacter sp.]
MTPRPVLLQATALLPSLEQRLADQYTMHRLPPAGPERDAFLAARGSEFDGLVTSAGVGAGADLIAALTRLRIISSFGVGLDTLDLAAARSRGIPVGYTPDVLNDCVADQAFALLLAIARRIPAADRFVRAGGWTTQPARGFPLGRQVSGARLGVVGLGRIGRTIARRAS